MLLAGELKHCTFVPVSAAPRCKTRASRPRNVAAIEPTNTWLPEPLGVGLVYYKLVRDIEVTDLRVARDGAPPTSVSQYANLGSTADVDNVNVNRPGDSLLGLRGEATA